MPEATTRECPPVPLHQTGKTDGRKQKKQRCRQRSRQRRRQRRRQWRRQRRRELRKKTDSPPTPSSPPSSSSPHANAKPGVVVYSAGGEFDIRQHYFELLSQDSSKSMPIAAIESLSALCDATRAGTIHELMSAIEGGAQALQRSIPNAISLTAGCDLFKRFIIAHAHDDPKDFEAFKQQLQASGHLAAQRAREARAQVAAVGVGAIHDGATVFLHGHSRCVVGLLRKAAQEASRRFTAIVTETRPSLLGLRTARELRAAGIPVAVVDDNAMAYALKKARLVLIGAEGVFGDGSILNIVRPLPPLLLRVANTGNRWARINWH